MTNHQPRAEKFNPYVTKQILPDAKPKISHHAAVHIIGTNESK
jgi:hypothetical protein